MEKHPLTRTLQSNLKVLHNMHIKNNLIKWFIKLLVVGIIPPPPKQLYYVVHGSHKSHKVSAPRQTREPLPWTSRVQESDMLIIVPLGAYTSVCNLEETQTYYNNNQWVEEAKQGYVWKLRTLEKGPMKSTMYFLDNHDHSNKIKGCVEYYTFEIYHLFV